MPQDGVTRIKYVQAVRRGDLVHLYFRKGEYREGPLASPPGSPELKAEVDAILKRIARMAAGQKPRANTLAGALRNYQTSADFLSNAASTRKEYARMLEDIAATAGDLLLSDITRSWVLEMRDLWAMRGYRLANLYVQMLKNALAPIIKDDADLRMTTDPLRDIDDVRRPSDLGEAHPVWRIEEVWTAINDAIARGKPGLARAIALGRFGGFRRGTICRLPLRARQAGVTATYEPETRLYWITEKRKVLCDKREDPRLSDVLDRTPNRALTIAYNAKGEPWKERQLNQALERHLDRLARDGKVRAVTDETGVIYCPLDIHGLRHSRGVELAESGASDAEIMAALEQLSTRAAAEYRRQADRKRSADRAQDRIDNVTRIEALRANSGAMNG